MIESINNESILNQPFTFDTTQFVNQQQPDTQVIPSFFEQNVDTINNNMETLIANQPQRSEIDKKIDAIKTLLNNVEGLQQKRNETVLKRDNLQKEVDALQNEIVMLENQINSIINESGFKM